MSRSRRAWTRAAAVAAIVLLIAAWWLRRLPPVAPADSGVIPALESVAIPISSDDPSDADADLEAVLPVLGNRRIVALGEATHGTREFFRLKDRLFRFLVRRGAFTTFALEISPGAGERMNRYVRDGAGTVDDALRQFEFWTWQTEEVRDLAQWMRAWNAGAADGRRVSFVGINATGSNRDEQMAANVAASRRRRPSGAGCV